MIHRNYAWDREEWTMESFIGEEKICQSLFLFNSLNIDFSTDNAWVERVLFLTLFNVGVIMQTGREKSEIGRQWTRREPADLWAPGTFNRRRGCYRMSQITCRLSLGSVGSRCHAIHADKSSPSNHFCP